MESNIWKSQSNRSNTLIQIDENLIHLKVNSASRRSRKQFSDDVTRACAAVDANRKTGIGVWGGVPFSPLGKRMTHHFIWATELILATNIDS